MFCKGRKGSLRRKEGERVKDGQWNGYQSIARILLKLCRYSFYCVNEKEIDCAMCDCSLYSVCNMMDNLSE